MIDMDKFIEEIDLGKLNNGEVDIEKYKDVLLEVSRVDEFRDYLRETIAADIKRYFFASKEQQDLIKGAYSRTYYLYKLLGKVSDDHTKSLTK